MNSFFCSLLNLADHSHHPVLSSLLVQPSKAPSTSPTNVPSSNPTHQPTSPPSFPVSFINSSSCTFHITYLIPQLYWQFCYVHYFVHYSLLCSRPQIPRPNRRTWVLFLSIEYVSYISYWYVISHSPIVYLFSSHTNMQPPTGNPTTAMPTGSPSKTPTAPPSFPVS